MKIISSAELRSNMKKYLDLASKERIVVQRGKNETFVLTKEEYLEPDDDFYRAISMEEFSKSAKDHISKLYAQEKV